MWQRMIKTAKENWILLAIVFLAAFLRFWNLTPLLHFTLDEELEAFVVKNIVTGYHYPAIGIFAGLLGVHLSPLFYYLAAIPFWLGDLNPVGWGVTASFLGTATTVLIYFVNNEMFSKRVAVFSAILYGTSFLVVMYDKHFWNVIPLPFVAVITVYSLYKILKGKLNWSIPLSLSLALGLSSHLSALNLAVLTVWSWGRSKLPFLKRSVLMALAIIVLSQLPLLVFELRHDFLQSKTVLKFLDDQEQSVGGFGKSWENLWLLPRVFSRAIYTFGSHDFAREHSYGWAEIGARDARVPQPMFALAVFLLVAFLYIAFKNRKIIALHLHASLLVVTVLSLLLGGFLVRGELFEYYLIYLFPTLATVGAFFLDRLWIRGRSYRLPVVMILAVLVLANVYAVLTSYHSYGLSKKIEIISWVKEKIGDSPYELHSIGVDHKYEGYRYLFEKFYKAPVRSYVDPQLAWLYQTPVSGTSPPLMVVISATEPAYQEQIEEERNLFLSSKIEEKQFGEINVMIVSRPLPPVALGDKRE